MAIECTLKDLLLAHKALRRINEEARLDAKSAWTVARMLRKMKPELSDHDDAVRKLTLDAGGQVTGFGQLGIEPIVRDKKESDATFLARVEARRLRLEALYKGVENLSEQKVSIDLDPLPLSIFTAAAEGAPALKVSGNDLADLGPFLADDQEEVKKT